MNIAVTVRAIAQRACSSYSCFNYIYKIYLFGPVLVHSRISYHARISNQQSLLKMSLV